MVMFSVSCCFVIMFSELAFLMFYIPWFIVFLLHCIAFHFISCLVLFCCTVHYCLFGFLIFNLLATSSINLSLNLYLIYSSFKFADIFRSVHFSSHALSNSYKYSRIDMFKPGRGYQYFSPSGYSVPRCC